MRAVMGGLVVLAGIVGCGKGPPAPRIPYSLAESKEESPGQWRMDFVVSEKASKEDVMRLMEWLRWEHRGKYRRIDIHDRKGCPLAVVHSHWPEPLWLLPEGQR